jgi:hypothetical protein
MLIEQVPQYAVIVRAVTAEDIVFPGLRFSASFADQVGRLRAML